MEGGGKMYTGPRFQACQHIQGRLNWYSCSGAPNNAIQVLGARSTKHVQASPNDESIERRDTCLCTTSVHRLEQRVTVPMAVLPLLPQIWPAVFCDSQLN
jgi:hypothetical protein